MKTFLYISLFLLINLCSTAKDVSKEISTPPLKVFYDGGGALFSYLRTDINFVLFVRNPIEAQVQLQINSQQTGDGGKKYSFFFTGLGIFENTNDTLVTSIPANVSDAEKNNELVRLVKLGLVTYISKTPYGKYVDVVFEENVSTEPQEDNWDNWVFNIGLKSSLEGEESKKEFLWQTNLNVDRIKEESKIKIHGNFSNEINKYEDDGELSKSSKKERLLSVLYVKSISPHFSAGISSEVKLRTYENIKTGINFSPALEYSVYPYSQSVRKRFTFLYRLGYSYNKYYRRTVFFKDRESLYQHSLTIDYELNELWGKAEFYLLTSNYLNDFSNNRIEFRTEFNFRISGSFFFDISAKASYVNDQIYLPAEDVTLEDILLNQIQLSTSYEYKFKFGVSYTFGSIYNSIVNTRF